MSTRNPIKAQVKQALLAAGLSEDIVRKGMQRGERWMRAAYGDADYETLRAESPDLVAWFTGYCNEAAKDGGKGATFNRQSFGGRRS
jgi:hypothetical protein